MKHKFTLIELLVVISIIMILMAFSMIGVPMVFERVRSTKCLNNLRDIGVAIHCYGTDNGGEYPFGAKGFDGKYLISCNEDLAKVLRTSILFVDPKTGTQVGTSVSEGVMSDCWYCPSAVKIQNITSYAVRVETKKILAEQMVEHNPLVVDKPNNHLKNERRNILFADGKVINIKNDDFENYLTDNTGKEYKWGKMTDD